RTRTAGANLNRRDIGNAVDEADENPGKRKGPRRREKPTGVTRRQGLRGQYGEGVNQVVTRVESIDGVIPQRGRIREERLHRRLGGSKGDDDPLRSRHRAFLATARENSRT